MKRNGWQLVLGIVVGSGLGCNQSPGATETSPPDLPAASVSSAVSAAAAPVGTSGPAASAPASAAVSGAPAVTLPSTCPDGMVKVEGGVFLMGAPYAHSPTSDYYRHKVALRSYCLDATEFTVEAYGKCVEKGDCPKSHDNQFSCTGHKEGRGDHPINCVDFAMAKSACKFLGKRLPTEEEWEYAARGGKEERTYSWGEAEPSQKLSCFDQRETCPVRAHPAGAFGLFGMTGNVWEWTASPFMTYAGWSPVGEWQVYRGGSYSRRFPKWMKTWVRNRFQPNEWGAHLGFRCASDVTGGNCPEGSTPVEGDPTRCLLPGEVIRKPPTAVAGPIVDNAPPPVVTRSPGFDADCAQYKPRTPVAYRIQGSSFAQRQSVVSRRGCSNRDVGTDFNSACCPN